MMRISLLDCFLCSACGSGEAEISSGSTTVRLSARDGLQIRRHGQLLLRSSRSAPTRTGDESRPGNAYAMFASAETERRRVEEALTTSHRNLQEVLRELQETQRQVVQQERLRVLGGPVEPAEFGIGEEHAVRLEALAGVGDGHGRGLRQQGCV